MELRLPFLYTGKSYGYSYHMAHPDTPILRPGASLADMAAAVDPPAAEAAPADAKDEAPATAVERWRKNLADVRLTEAEAEAILDDVLTKGYWAKSYSLLRGRVQVTFRTRDVYHQRRVANAVDQFRLPTPDKTAAVYVSYNLAGSLAAIDARGFPAKALNHPDPYRAKPEEIETAFNERLAYVEKLPGPLLGALTQALGHFETLVNAALSEGAPEGF